MVSLTGTGVSASSHSVALTWDASASTGIIGYFVYRGAVSGGPYTKQNSSADTILAFTDSGLISGQTYFYVVTAVDGSNVESGFSSEVLAAIP
jgi:fibronectin type 3 domain-containing protein